MVIHLVVHTVTLRPLEEKAEPIGSFHVPVIKQFCKASDENRDGSRLRGDPAEQIEIWLQIGTIQEEKLDDKVAEAATYHEILQYSPANMEASGRLEAIYEGGAQWADLAGLLEMAAEDEGFAAEVAAEISRLEKVL